MVLNFLSNFTHVVHVVSTVGRLEEDEGQSLTNQHQMLNPVFFFLLPFLTLFSLPLMQCLL